MTKARNFILHSGYATLKNDGNVTTTFTIPSGIVIGAGGNHTISKTVTVGSEGGSLRVRMRIQGATRWLVTSSANIQFGVSYDNYGNASNTSAVSVERINATQVRIYVFITNQSDSIMRTTQTRNLDVRINTFLSPFQ